MKVSKLTGLGERHLESEFTEADGAQIISSLRKIIERHLKNGANRGSTFLDTDLRFQGKRGCFTTLRNNDKEKSLRGCIGFPEPVYELGKALRQSAIAAATEDPRFPPLTEGELDSVTIEVSILTRPVLVESVSRLDIPRKIKIGKDGLILKWAFGSGLLLPQVATEYNWDAIEFLSNLSMKAGALPDEWTRDGNQIFKFQALIFGEQFPLGPVRAF